MRIASSITQVALYAALVLTHATTTDALDQAQQVTQSRTIHIRVHNAAVVAPKPVKPRTLAPPVQATQPPLGNKTPGLNQKTSAPAQKPSTSTKKPESPDVPDVDASEVRECLPLSYEPLAGNIVTACTWGNGEGTYSALYLLDNGDVMSKCVCDSRSSLIPYGFYWGTADMTIPTEDAEPSATICYSVQQDNTYENVLHSFYGYVCPQE
jgi:hypothetical protein